MSPTVSRVPDVLPDVLCPRRFVTEVTQKSLDAGCGAFVTKPATLQLLTEALNQFTVPK